MKSLTALLLAAPLCMSCQVQVNGRPNPGTTPTPAPTASPSTRPAASASGQRVSDEKSLTEHLRTKGADVKPGEALEQPFLRVKGKSYTVNGETLQVYEYATAQALEADASQISPDGGSTSTTMISWMDDPHFFRQGRVMVIYVGKNRAVLDLLQTALGPQFAGR